MNILFRLIAIFVHLSLSAIFIDFLGDQMSQQQNIFITLFEGLILSLIMVSIILHAKNFILSFKKQKP